MPMGKYKDFAACVRDHKSKGHDEKSANAICGEIKKKTESKTDDWRILNFIVPIQNAVKTDEGFKIRGIALNETTTRNNVKYIAEELEPSAITLVGKPILKNHNNDVDDIVGIVQYSNYNPSIHAIEFEGKIEDESMKQKIEKGLIRNVSVGAFVKDLRKDDKDESTFIAKGIEFFEISLVAVPADPGASFAKAIAESYSMKERIEHSPSEIIDGTYTITTESKQEAKTMADNAINYEEKFNSLKLELESFKKELTEKEVAKVKAEEQAKVKEQEAKSKSDFEAMQKELSEIKAKIASSEAKTPMKGEVGKPNITEDTNGVFIGEDVEYGKTVIARYSYPKHLKNFQHNVRGE